ncbi:di-heme oxidoreductase family protein [Tenacibaculum maritimum]|uniref:di-heme oxidoreductase family protein n=1 Tax=Tenacibaculum maritimum TaxID=107401 RepID=UPI00042A098C|nr:di-heme oxidoredictase family protein [Tenacibaculum maritimum]CAA0150464.1 Probable lipoprotein precursor [Tenacibaculum maritimum]CAA0177922.1 Probable lipoprotein precursor [Tenacibaculum maritimum]CAA0195162.1 Probable lipoprotein precursor [Tenacibaculum maritimum]
MTKFLAPLLIASIFFSCSNKETYIPTNIATYEKDEELLAGKLTTRILGSNAFDQAVPGLPDQTDLLFFVGNSLFRQNWVSAPASTTARDGLGPTFNARACSSCHNKDGRGTPLQVGQQFSAGFLMRISLNGNNPHGEPIPVPNYGNQIQEHANLGIPYEAKVTVKFETIKGSFADGETYELKKPIYTIIDEQFGTLQNVLTSPRVGQQVIGLGLVDAIANEAILANTDEFDLDDDGISGKANYVWDVLKKETVLGRFGWKANAPNLQQQVAGAFSGDMGLTTSLFPNENCPSPQQDCQNAPNGGAPEITDRALKQIMIYSSSLSVPIRRNFKNENVLRGKQLFREMKCASCHIETFTTSDKYPINPTLTNVKIRPYSDFLLHDMGADLADNRPDFLANGKEWRTQPLWGIGMIKEVNGHTFLLHDGRARNIEEAILWHGGEAHKAKESYKKLKRDDRLAVLAFINSL